MRYVAGYTIVNDFVVDCYTRVSQQNRMRFDVETPTGFHIANAASWLDKSVDTMCSIGPSIVTPDEVPDAYDLLSSLSVQGIPRNRAHSGALLAGVEQLVSWASSLFPLAPGSVLHLGAMGRDGIPVDLEDAQRIGGVQIRAEVAKIGSLTNTVSIATATGSSGAHDDSETPPGILGRPRRLPERLRVPPAERRPPSNRVQHAGPSDRDFRHLDPAARDNAIGSRGRGARRRDSQADTARDSR